MRPQHLRRRSFLARTLRAAYAVVLAVIALCALLVGGTWTLLQSRWGSDLVRRIALRQANRALAGRIAVARLAFGGNRLSLADVEVRDPTGRTALAIDRIEVAVSPLALLRGRLETTALSIRHPRVYLVQDRDGLGIGRAFSPRNPAPPEKGQQKQQSGFAIEIHGFTITGGMVEYRRDGGLRVRLEDLTGTGVLRLANAFELATTITSPALDVSGRWTLDLSSPEGRSDLEATVRATIPGTSVRARGKVATERLDLAATVDASDLAATAEALTPILGTRPALAGRGHVDATLVGPPRTPTLRVTASAPAIAVADVHARDLRGSAVVPDLQKPAALEVELAAQSARLGARHLTSPMASVRTTGPRIGAQLRAELPTPVAVTLDGRRERGDAAAIAVDRLDLVYPGAHWALERPAHLRFGAGHASVSDLALVDGPQHLEVDFAKRGRVLGGHVGVTALDLGRLAPLLAPAGPRFAGRLDARIEGESRGQAPKFDATATLAGGQLGRVRDLVFAVDAHGDRDRIRGQATAKAIGASAEARFDVPERWPIRRGRAPIEIDLRVGDTDLAQVASAAAAAADLHLPPLRGHVRFHAKLGGTTAEPTLAADADGRALAVNDRPVGNVVLAVHGAQDQPLAVELTGSALGGAPNARTAISVRAPLSLRDLLAGAAPTRLADGPLDASAEVNALPFAAVARLWPAFPAARGTLSAHAKVSGTTKSPEAHAEVQIAGAASERFPPTDADVKVTLEKGHTAGQVSITRQGHALLEARADLKTGWRGLADRAALAAVPVDVEATIGPLPLKRSGLPTGQPGHEAGTLRADVQADLKLAGTLSSPRLNTRTEVRNVRLDQLPLGAGHVEGTYGNRKAAIDVQWGSPSGGSLHARLGADVDFGGLILGHSVALAHAPIDLRLQADRVDLRALSGIVPAVRSVSGTLDGDVDGHGTFAAPRFAGRLEWKQGALTVSGYGDYRDVHLVVHGDEQRIELDELAAKSGDGRAHVTGKAVRDSGGYRLSAQANISRFLLYTSGQPLGRLSLDATVDGTATPRKNELATDIKNAKVELADAQRRDLQPLDMPPDVILVEHGRPKGREQEAKLRALSAAVRGASGTPAPPSAPAPPTAHTILTIRSAERVWVSGKDAKLELSIEPGMRVVVGDQARIYGTVTVRRGRVNVLGKRFDIRADSTVRWNGPADRPELDVEAQYENSNEGITVIVTIKGSPGSMDISMRSPTRPELTTSQLFALIVSGHLEGGTGRSASEPFSASNEAASLVGGLLATGLQTTIGKRLPLDVFTIDAGGGTSLSGTQLEAGRYVTDRLYVGYIGRIGADPTRYQNRNAVHAEYRLSSRWQIVGEYGDVGTGSADAVWKKNY